jgi:putative two-component system response regulator
MNIEESGEEIIAGPVDESKSNAQSASLIDQSIEVAAWSRKEYEGVYGQMYRYAADFQTLRKNQASVEFELDEARQESMFRLALVLAVSHADDYASMVRVGILSALVAHELGLSKVFCDYISMAAPLRNIGLIGLNAGSQAGLHMDTQADQNQEQVTAEGGSVYKYKDHPWLSAAILGGSYSPAMQMAEEIALNHHERYDGKGYPRGLFSDEIPLSARIVAAVAWFDGYLSAQEHEQKQEQGEKDFLEKWDFALRAQATYALDPWVSEAIIQCSDLLLRVRHTVTAQESTDALDLPRSTRTMWTDFLSPK